MLNLKKEKFVTNTIQSNKIHQLGQFSTNSATDTQIKVNPTPPPSQSKQKPEVQHQKHKF